MSGHDALHDEREEARSLRNAEDKGGHRRIGGQVFDEWPSEDEL